MRLAISESQSGLVKEPCLEAKVAGYSKGTQHQSTRVCMCTNTDTQLKHTNTDTFTLKNGGVLLFVTISYIGYQEPNSSSRQVLSGKKGRVSLYFPVPGN